MNIIEYVRAFGDDPFKARPFGEVDSLVLSELVYFNFTGILNEDAPRKTIAELKPFAEKLIENTLLPKNNARLIDALAQSARFSSIRLGYFKEYNDEAAEVRFAALTCILPDGTAYIAYRGTDITLLGWKEDFNMAFRRKIPSQTIAVEYLNAVTERETGKLIVGGHSKGGNLAVYAAVYAMPRVADALVAVYDHDGPGFQESIFETAEYRRVADRIFKTVPQDSLVGILLFHSQNYRVVLSKSVLIGQHNPFAWAVADDGTFVELPKTTAGSRRLDRTLQDWGETIDDATRRKLVEALYTVILGSGATTVPEFRKGFFKKVRGMKRAFRSLPEESRLLLKKQGKDLVRVWVHAARKQRES